MRIKSFHVRRLGPPEPLRLPGTGGGHVTHATRASVMRPAPVTAKGNLVSPGSRIRGAVGQAITATGVHVGSVFGRKV